MRTSTSLSVRRLDRSRSARINSQPALVFYHDNAPFAALLLAIADDRIHRVFHADLRRLAYLGRRTAQ
jgi:hypothetical protein